MERDYERVFHALMAWVPPEDLHLATGDIVKLIAEVRAECARPMTRHELQTALALRVHEARNSIDGDLQAFVSLAIRQAEPEWEQDLCVGEAMEGTSWLEEEHIQKLCDAAAAAALAVAEEAIRAGERERCAQVAQAGQDQDTGGDAWSDGYNIGREEAAAAIRASGEREEG